LTLTGIAIRRTEFTIHHLIFSVQLIFDGLIQIACHMMDRTLVELNAPELFNILPLI